MTTGTHHLIDLDPAVVAERFGRGGYLVRHELQDHPLTRLEALAELADALPSDRLEHNLGSVGDVVLNADEVPRADLTPGEIVRTIESNGCWMVMGIHGIPGYDEILDELFVDIVRTLPATEGEVRRRQGVIFLSAPNSTTPTHIDGEQSYLLQITGTKKVSIGTFVDDEAAHREIERYCGGGHRNIADLPAERGGLRPQPGCRHARAGADAASREDARGRLDLDVGRLRDRRADPPCGGAPGQRPAAPARHHPGAPGRPPARRPRQGAGHDDRERRQAAREPPELSEVPALEVTVFERTPPAEVMEAWRALAVAAENPFALPDWQAAWCAAHPQDAPRTFVCRREDGEVAGVLPLVVRTRRRRRVVLAPGDGAADFCAPACAPADSAAVAHAVLRELAGAPRAWELWRLERVRRRQRVVAARSPRRRARPGSRCCPGARSRRSWWPTCSDRDDLIDAKQRRDIARLRRRLERDHAVVVRTSEGPEEARRDLGELLRLHAARWGPGTFPAPVRAFHADFAARAAERGWLRLHTLEVDGRPAAVLYGWRLNTRAFAYSQAFDPAYARYAVGISLLVSAVEQAAAEGCAHFDMLRGDEQHKQRFRISSHPLESHLVARRRSPAMLEALAASAARRAWARLPARGRAARRPADVALAPAHARDPLPVAVQRRRHERVGEHEHEAAGGQSREQPEGLGQRGVGRARRGESRRVGHQDAGALAQRQPAPDGPVQMAGDVHALEQELHAACRSRSRPRRP